MKSYIELLLTVLLLINPIIAIAGIEGYQIVGMNEKENITLYAKNMNRLFREFKIDFKDTIYQDLFGLETLILPMLRKLFLKISTMTKIKS